MNQIKIILNKLPPSLNTLYPTGKHGKRFKDTRAKKFSIEMMQEMMVQGIHNEALDNIKFTRGIIYTKLLFSFPLSLAAERDLDNMGKLIIDTLAEYFHFDDNCLFIRDIYYRYRPANKEQAIIFIEHGG